MIYACMMMTKEKKRVARNTIGYESHRYDEDRRSCMEHYKVDKHDDDKNNK